MKGFLQQKIDLTLGNLSIKVICVFDHVINFLDHRNIYIGNNPHEGNGKHHQRHGRNENTKGK